MKKINLLWMVTFLLLSLGKGLAQQLHLVTPNTSLVLSAQEGDDKGYGPYYVARYSIYGRGACPEGT